LILNNTVIYNTVIYNTVVYYCCEQSVDQTTSAACSSIGLNSSSVVYETAWPDTSTRDRPAADNEHSHCWRSPASVTL